MIWNEVDAHSLRVEIYVQTKTLRHLVELYVTKRIDAIITSMKIAVERQVVIDTTGIPNYCRSLTKMHIFRRTQCELLSVHASLSHERTGRWPRI